MRRPIEASLAPIAAGLFGERATQATRDDDAHAAMAPPSGATGKAQPAWLPLLFLISVSLCATATNAAAAGPPAPAIAREKPPISVPAPAPTVSTGAHLRSQPALRCPPFVRVRTRACARFALV